MVNSYDEWTKLKRVIVGRAENFHRYDIDESFILFFLENIYPMLGANEKQFISNEKSLPTNYIDISQRILNELIEDIQDFCLAIEKQGVEVVRPTPLLNSQEAYIKTPNWESYPTPALNIRDQAIILGNTIVETAPHVRARLFENDCLHELFYDYFDAGANWICMPRPTLRDGVLDGSYFDNEGLDYRQFLTQPNVFDNGVPSTNYEMVIDGAQFIRFGEDIIVNIANENHKRAYKWFEKNFGDEFTFHKIERMADNHIDSIVLPLRPGLLLVRDPIFLEFLPNFLQNWDFIVAPEPKETSPLAEYPETIHLASKYVDINVLSLDEETVIVNELYPELIRVLESNSFNVLPVRHRHRRIFSGGFHCFTLDVERQGKKQKYT